MSADGVCPTCQACKRQKTEAAPVKLEVALADKDLLEMVADRKTFQNFGDDMVKFVQPASIDIPLSGTAILVKEKVLPFQQRVRELLPELTIEERPLAGLSPPRPLPLRSLLSRTPSRQVTTLP